MDLYRLLGIQKPRDVRIPAEFPVTMERKTRQETQQFDARVKGFFVPKGGKADFVPSEITVEGAPEMNLSSFFPSELRKVSRYALTVEFPRRLARRLS
jgi:hypothetical protein